MAKSDIRIKPSKRGTLRAAAKKSGGINKEGNIDEGWIVSKMNNPKTTPAMKKKLNFARTDRIARSGLAGELF